MWKDSLNNILSRFGARARVSRYSWLLGAVATALGALLVFRWLYLPLFAALRDRYARVQELQVKIDDVQLLKRQQPTQERALVQMTARYTTLERQVGTGQSVARILETLSQQAKHHRLELVAVQPPAEDSEPVHLRLGPEMALQAVPLTVHLTGRYRQVGEFLGELSHASFLSSVRRLTITRPNAERATLQADLVLFVYLAKELR